MDETIYDDLQRVADSLLRHLKATSSGEEFLATLNERQFESMRETLGYCFFKVNELSFFYCESVKKGEEPNTDERNLMFAFPIAAIAQKIGIWDGSKDSPFYHYSEFAKGRFSEKSSREILKNQKAIEDFSNTLYYNWCEIHNRGVFLKRVA